MASFSETRPETREQNIPTFIKPSNKKISRDVSKYLDGLGFSRKQIWNRIRYMNIKSKVVDIAIKFNKKTNNERIFVGSKCEGLGLKGLSELDVLQVEHDVICTKKVSYVDHARLVLKIVDSNTPPGYCQLKVDKSAVDSRIFKNYMYATVQRDGNTFLSSMQFVTELKDEMLNVSKFTKKHTAILPQHGPSIPRLANYSSTISLDTLYPERKVQSDFVRAFPCDERTALNVWQNRPRNYDWPSRSLVGQIMTLPIYVVPVGHKGSINEDLEWRISFVCAEIKLVQSFNNIQMKIFLLLKIVAKHYLDSESEIISSYVIKNVMFWLAEDIPQTKFRQKHLMARMIDALQKLKKFVMTKSLQTYMQPERNLFANKLNDAEQQLVLSKIDNIMCHWQTELCRFLYDEGPSNIATKIVQIVNDLQTCNLATKNKIYEFLQTGTKNALHIFLIKLNLKSEKELILAALYIRIMKNANTSDANIKNDTYCSRKLLEAEKELRATTIMDIKPGTLERWRINTVTFTTRFVSKLWYLPIMNMLEPSDRDTKLLIQQSVQENIIEERPLAPPVLLWIAIRFLILILCPSVLTVCYSINILLFIFVYLFQTIIYTLPLDVLIVCIRLVMMCMDIILWFYIPRSFKKQRFSFLVLSRHFESLALISSMLTLYVDFQIHVNQCGLEPVKHQYLGLASSVVLLILALFSLKIRFRLLLALFSLNMRFSFLFEYFN